MKATKIYGPPGTGKTTELIHRVSSSDKKTLMLTFTKAAAKEISERIKTKAQISTIHALCYKHLGINKSQIFSHHQEFADETGIPVEGKQTFGSESVLPGDTALEAYHKARASKRDVESDEEPIDFIKHVVTRYEAFKQSRGLLDFDDLLDRFIAQHPGDLHVSRLYVDEGQDLSPHQWDVIRHIASHVSDVTIAGDDDQAIFQWAGADPHGMARWDGEDVILGTSHRIPRSVHRLASAILARIPDRKEKTYLPRAEEGAVYRADGIDTCPPPKGSTMILFRNHSARREVFEWLMHMHPTPFLGVGSPFQGKWAMALRALLKLKRGEEADAKAIQRVCKDFSPRHVAMNPFHVLEGMPDEIRDYLKAIDPEATPTVTASTIHAAKGAEADNVILHLGMGERTSEEAGIDEHRVWYVAVTRAKNSLWLVDGDNAYCI